MSEQTLTPDVCSECGMVLYYNRPCPTCITPGPTIPAKHEQQRREGDAMTVSRERPMKAYKVSCADDDHGVAVTFAERAKDADWRANDNCDCEYIRRRIKREPKFDKYSPGPLTIRNCLDEGWQWPCAGCEKYLWDEDAPIIEGDYAFCSIDCAKRELAEIIERNYTHESMARFRKVIEALIAKEQS